ncbi:Uncharacterised protein [Chlamydia trachomatis]|nr:Uncharacterised protein [Chlamydia trachomatis]
MIVSDTDAIIVAPPGEPMAMKGFPSFNTKVGDILLLGLFPGSTWLTPPGVASKSVISLFSMNP